MRGMGIYVVFTLINIRGMMKAYGYILLCCLGLLCGAVGKALAASMHGGGEYVTISGIVKDRSDKKALAYASVSVAEGTESTVANADGELIEAGIVGKGIYIVVATDAAGNRQNHLHYDKAFPTFWLSRQYRGPNR